MSVRGPACPLLHVTPAAARVSESSLERWGWKSSLYGKRLSARVFLAGYNADPNFTPDAAWVIHHPGGNAKRISFANKTCAESCSHLLLFLMWCRLSPGIYNGRSISNKFADVPFPDSALLPTSDTHFRVRLYLADCFSRHHRATEMALV